MTDVFNVPTNHPKSKPFLDHVYHFSYVENRIYFRHYQIFRDTNLEEKIQEEKIDLIEIGPRFTLNPIRIFEGFMEGKVVYDNPFYIRPRQRRRDLLGAQARVFLDRQARKRRKADLLAEVLEGVKLSEATGIASAFQEINEKSTVNTGSKDMNKIRMKGIKAKLARKRMQKLKEDGQLEGGAKGRKLVKV